MGVYEKHVVPRLVDVTLRGKTIEGIRAEVAAGLRGTVLEVGFGSGRNVPHYPGTVDRVLAVDPSSVGRAMSGKHVAASSTPIEFIGLDGEQLPVADDEIDTVLITWTLCTIPDAHQALREINRVLRPSGTMHFVEHGRAEDPKVVRWQDRLNPIQQRIAGGCNLNRPIADLIEGAGLELTELDTGHTPGMPKSFSYFYRGVATKS
ncbi:MAG TPA: class I SAM-dependent methyltransferase [Acidimicrobiales bacterium]|jgi:ubiquinone/menaquinone biosynthesis C-methylase UbiE|nr:class I SAM-dependent methyltransferase [Acidimicrobiales bacterium]